MRDASVLIFYYVRRWIKRRRARKGIERAALSKKQTTAKVFEKNLAAKRLLHRTNTSFF